MCYKHWGYIYSCVTKTISLLGAFSIKSAVTVWLTPCIISNADVTLTRVLQFLHVTEWCPVIMPFGLRNQCQAMLLSGLSVPCPIIKKRRLCISWFSCPRLFSMFQFQQSCKLDYARYNPATTAFELFLAPNNHTVWSQCFIPKT